MLVRLLVGLSLSLLPLVSTQAQVFECDFGRPRPKVFIDQMIFRTPIPLPPARERSVRKGVVGLAQGIGSEHWAEALRGRAEELVSEAYQDEGYFRATVSAELKEVRDRGDLHTVNLVFKADPGKLYRLAGVHWRGNSAISVDELGEAMQVVPGEVFHREKVANGLEAIHRLYSSRGYINSVYVPTPEADDNLGTLSFDIYIDEGKQFRFGELDIHEMQEAHRKVLLTAWRELQGKP